ncbi:globin [Burkholderia sp. D7]|nr:globin [Burkholderia sp. D7]
MTEANIEQAPQPTAFELVGGEERVRALVDRFYDLMDLEPEFAALRALHPPRSRIHAINSSGSCAAGWAARIITSAALGIRGCGLAT